MTYINKTIIIIALSCLFLARAEAQAQPTDTLHNAFAITGKVMEDRIILRWAPSTFSAWMLANKTGYVLERAVSDTDPSAEDFSGSLSFLPVPGYPKVPYTIEQWRKLADTTNLYVATAAQAQWGKSMAAGTGGGAMDLIHNLNTQQSTRHAMGMLAADLNAEAATGLGLRHEDGDVATGKYYTYRVFNVPGKKGIVTDTAYVTLRAGTVSPRMPVQGVYVENGHNKVTVMWNMPVNSIHFTGYHVERADQNGEFKRITRLPVVCSVNENESADCSFRDTTVFNAKKYRYRVIGLDPFATEGLPSKEIDAQPVDQVGPPPAHSVTVEDKDGGFEISWTGDHSSADHGGWYVGRAMQATGPFILLHEEPLPKTTRSYFDKEAVPLITNYYVVYSADIHDNKNISGVNAGIRSDSIPPAKPTNLKGMIDSTGLVTLYWDLGNEPDLMGYRVFRANSKDREFYQVTSNLVGDNSYTESLPLNSLAEEMYYMIVALDLHYNPSLYSEILAVRLPDTIAPAEAMINKYEFRSNGLFMEWAPSSSTDVTEHRVWRKDGSNDWRMIYTTADASATQYVDESIKWNTSYTYAIEAVDDAGLSSGRSQELHVRTPVRAAEGKVTNVSGTFDKESKSYSLSWDYEGPDPAKFIVYRSVDGQPMEWYGEADTDQRAYTDKQFYKSETGYAYLITALFADGTSIPAEAPYVVQVKR